MSVARAFLAPSVLPAACCAAAAALALLGGSGCGHSAAAPDYSLDHTTLEDPQSCQGCHPDQFQQWSGSMHAYASVDPVFVAMNARGQRETNGALGTFCLQCHAPGAVRLGGATGATDPATLPADQQGVNCYFCHSVDAVNGTNDNPLALATDDVMRGGLMSPVANTAHASAYSTLHDRAELVSASLCGSCHDVVNTLGVHLESTYAEWQASIFSHPEIGLACGECHMAGTQGLAAQAPNVFVRTVHNHEFPAVDTALIPFPETATQLADIQSELTPTLQSELCVKALPGAYQVQVILDNVGVGHGWPSGVVEDRRAWVEVIAYQGSKVVYQSGVVADGDEVVKLADPDLWLLRDCMFDAQGTPVDMFWQAASVSGFEMPGPTTNVTTDPAYYLTHIYETYPRPTSTPSIISVAPDKVTMRVQIQSIGLDVIDDLVASGDLDAGIRAQVPTFTLTGSVLTWTPATATDKYIDQGAMVTCVTDGLMGGTQTAHPPMLSTTCKP
jgi:hypothetical protein